MSVSSFSLPCYIPSLTHPVNSLRQILSSAAKDAGLALPNGLPEARPNTDVRFKLYDDKSFPAFTSPLNPEVWRELLVGYPGTLSSDIQGMIMHGAKIGYDLQGPLRFSSRRGTRNLPMDEGASDFVEREIRRRLERGEVRLAEPEEHIVTSPIGAVPKPSVNGEKKFRMIHHLSHPRRRSDETSVNAGIRAEDVTMQYSSLDIMMQELGTAARRDTMNAEGRILWKVDLKDAYRHVVVEQADARLLGYFWSGIGFVYETQLSFGGRSAPFIFNLFAEALEWILRSLGVECQHYLDDSYGWLDRRHNSKAVLALIGEVASRLGLSIAPHKTMLGPVVEVLGITIDCNAGIAYIAAERLHKIRQQIEGMQDSTNLVQIQSLTGSLVFVTRVCTVGRAFLRRLFDQVRICEAVPFARRRLTQDAKRELRWWKDTFTTINCVRYLADDPDFLPECHVWSDASGSLGIGGHLDNTYDEFSERIPEKHSRKDILFKEALAVLRCVQIWAEKMRRHLVVFHVDNQALMAALNSGSCRHRPAQAIVRRIYTLAAWESFSFRAVWLSSEDNLRADRLSRFKSHAPSDAIATMDTNPHFDPDLAFDDGISSADNIVPDNAYDISDYADWAMHPAINFYTWNGVSAATRNKHESILHRFLAYKGRSRASIQGAFSVPIHSDEVLEWLAVSAEFVQASTVLSWMGSLRAALSDLCMDTTYFDSRDFEMFRQGIRRVKGEPAPRTALPITLPILSMVNRTILERGPLSSYERLLIATAFSVAFACFLRVGEITYTEFDPLVHLQRQDVLFSPQGLSIRIKASKTDPSRKGIILPLPVISTPAYSHVCPSNLLRMLLASTPGQPSDPLFCFASGKKNFDAKRLIRECRQALMQNGFSIADMDGRMFSGHSFRRGAATWAAKVGLNDRTIMLLGRWSVKSLPGGHQRYVDITLEDRRAYVSALYSASPGLENRQMGFIFEEDPAELEYMDDGLPPQ